MTTAGYFLVGISGICWTIVYIELIRKGFKDKACGMPLFALGLNIVWEFLYSIDGFFISKEFIMVQNIADMAWALCDVLILACWFKFGRQYLPENAKNYFIPYTILALIICVGMQFAFYLYCDSATQASIYSAFAQNVAMSVMFLAALFERNSTKGFSLLGAVCKCIGTLTPTIWGCVEIGGIQIYILITGILCLFVDLIYIYFFIKHKALSQEK
jgi:drug/metabolite transporter (DMT)-like permease